MKLTNRLLTLSIMLMTLGQSCKKSKSTPPANEPDPDQPKPTEKKAILPVKIVYGKLTTEYEYFPGTARLKAIKKSTGYTYQFQYKSDTLLYIYKIFQNSKEIYEIYLSRNADLVPTETPRFKVEGNVYTPEGHDKLYCNSSKQLIKSENYHVSNQYVSEKIFSYDTQGSLVSTANTAGTPDIQHKLTYDDKNGIFKHLENPFLIYLLHDDIFMATPNHNIMSYTSIQQPDDNMTITYEYNLQNYPIKMIVSRPKWTETHLITYQEITLQQMVSPYPLGTPPFQGGVPNG